jgi:hypothetical protein
MINNKLFENDGDRLDLPFWPIRNNEFLIVCPQNGHIFSTFARMYTSMQTCIPTHFCRYETCGGVWNVCTVRTELKAIPGQLVFVVNGILLYASNAPFFLLYKVFLVAEKTNYVLRCP